MLFIHALSFNHGLQFTLCSLQLKLQFPDTSFVRQSFATYQEQWAFAGKQMARGEKRPPSCFLLSPVLSHQLCLLVLIPAAGHRLQLILRLLEAQRMSHRVLQWGLMLSFLCGLRSPCMTSLKFWDPILSILFSQLQSSKCFPPSKLFPLATTAFTFSFFTLLPAIIGSYMLECIYCLGISSASYIFLRAVLSLKTGFSLESSFNSVVILFLH